MGHSAYQPSALPPGQADSPAQLLTTRHAIRLGMAKQTGMGSADWHVLMFDIHLRKILWVYCPGHAGVKGIDRADRLVGKATTQAGCVSEDLKC